MGVSVTNTMVYDKGEWGMCSAPTRHMTKVRPSIDSPHQVVISCWTPEYQYPWFYFYCDSLFQHGCCIIWYGGRCEIINVYPLIGHRPGSRLRRRSKYNSEDGPTVVEDDEDEGEMSSSMEDPNINYCDVDDDGMDIEDDGVRHCKSDPWRTNFSMGSILNITPSTTVKRNSYIYSICMTLFIGVIPRFCIPHCPNLQSICVCRRSTMCIPKIGDQSKLDKCEQ